MPHKGLWVSPNEFMAFDEGSSAPESLSKELATRSRSLDYYAIGNMYLPNPDPILKSQGSDIRVYTDLQTDDRVAGSMTNRINATLALNWRIEKGKGGARQSKAIQEIFEKLDVNRIISDILHGARGFGYAPMETVWAPVNGINAPVDVIGKPQKWFVFSAYNELRFLSRDHMVTGEILPERRFLCPTNEASYLNPYGIGNLSRCFWPVVFKRGGWRFWIQFSEKFGQVWPIGKLPRSASQTQIEDFLDILERMIADGVAVIPDDGSVDFKESGSKGATSDLYRGIIAEANSAVSTVWLGHAGAGESVPGELGGKQTAAEVREDLRDSDCRLVEQAMNTLIGWIYAENWGGPEGADRFVLYPDEKIDITQAERDDKLSNSLAASGLRLTKVYFKRVYKLDDADIEEKAADPAQPVAVATPDAGKRPAQFSETRFTADGIDSADVVADRLDAEAGPLVDGWLSALQREVELAGNLVDLRDELLRRAESVKLAPVAGVIRDALLLARLSGRGEVIDEIAASERGGSFAEFSDPTMLSVLRLPFAEAIAFFRNKTSIPTEKWNDLWLDAHSQGFMIAGAMEGELLSDIRDAVDQAIAAGTTLADFRKQWDAIVERHGWKYNGGRNWRTRIVYETNTRQAYNAGRWQQVTDPEVLRTRPYLLYKHGDSIRPRIPHLAWDGTVLPADDPWWSTHYPQNGWGCKCKVFSAGERDIARLGDQAKRVAPNDGTYTWTDKQGREWKIPEGIDPGFQYNPGTAALKSKAVLEDRIAALPTDIAKTVRDSIARESNR